MEKVKNETPGRINGSITAVVLAMLEEATAFCRPCVPQISFGKADLLVPYLLQQ